MRVQCRHTRRALHLAQALILIEHAGYRVTQWRYEYIFTNCISNVYTHDQWSNGHYGHYMHVRYIHVYPYSRVGSLGNRLLVVCNVIT